MNTCSTCQHWVALDSYETLGRPTPFGSCKRVPQDIEYESSGHQRQPDDESVLEEPAVVIDGSGYFAELRTKADFGCVLHEPIQLGNDPA